MVRIQHEDFSLDDEVNAVVGTRPNVGGIVTFLGTVRDYAEDTEVIAIELEHYPGMTERELEKIEAAALARFAVEAIHVVHRVGRLAVGERIVLVVAAAKHRAEAFEACRFVIDHLKIHATLWKKEITAQGERWVDSCPGCLAAATHWEDMKHVAHTHAVTPTPPDHHAHGEANWSGLRVAILTLSDSRTLANDQSGDALEGMVLAHGARVGARALLPDEKGAIREQLIHWADGERMDVILTTGGTGPGPRDITPEATREVCDRELPGLAEIIRGEGLKQTRSAALTRGVAALRGVTLVINLPGSRRGSTHSLQAIADLVPHVLNMARGGGHG